MASQDSAADARYQAKLAARADGTAKVVVMPAAEEDRHSPQGTEADQRYVRKLAARAAKGVMPAAEEPEQKPATETRSKKS